MGLSMPQTAAPSSHQPPLDGTPAERLAETFAPAHMREGV